MSFKIKKNLCILLLILLALLAFFPQPFWGKQEGREKGMEKEELLSYHRLVKLLAKEYFNEESEKHRKLEEAEEIILQWEDGKISHRMLNDWTKAISEIWEISREDGEKEEEKKKTDLSSFMEKEEAEAYIYLLLQKLDKEEKMKMQSLMVLGDHHNVTDLEGKNIDEELIFTNNGKWKLEIGQKEELFQKQIECLTYKGSIWWIKEVFNEGCLQNVWIQETEAGSLTYFYKNYYVETTYTAEEKLREQVADLIFEQGKIKEINQHTQRLTGKAEKITEKEIELKNLGSFPFEQEVQYYRLHGRLEAVGRNEIPLEEGMTDFVIEDGKIQAVLLVRDEKMEQLRVLIKTKDFKEIFHENLTVFSDVEMELISKDKVITIPAGEEVTFNPESEYFSTGRVYLIPKALTGRTYISQLERKNGDQGYSGKLEIEKREEGMLLVNEVSLEEYLYAVLPSEMPSSYPLEALKAQAISARTYAYRKMLQPALPQYGANLDDSSSYQVYNNIAENGNTTEAVRATKGQLLYEGTKPATTYYYSTSCGYGTDASIWNNEGNNPYFYLRAREMTAEDGEDSVDLKEEKSFREFIQKKSEDHIEHQEAWYRWTYEHNNMERIKENIINMRNEHPEYLTITGKEEEIMDGDFRIEEMKVEERGEGGVIKVLLILTEEGEIRVNNEYRIRSLLTDGSTYVCLQNQQTYACENLLPSAFFMLDTVKEEVEVKEIRLTGGGFGHGVGMSQNGAKNLAELGYEAKQILEYYYQGCEVR